jgi:hypothetical protein
VTTPRRGLLFHFTHVDNLRSVIDRGLRSDNAVRADGSLAVEIGEDRIKAQRRGRNIPIGPGGVVADYVPFYFAARSPMLYTISRGNVRRYQGGQDPLVYLVTAAPRLQAAGCRFVFTDRNAALTHAAYADDPADLGQLVDWPLMEARMWNNTDTEPDRMERRMAEFLVYGSVPFAAVAAVGVRSEEMERAVDEVLRTLDAPPMVVVRPDWYF